MKKISGVIANGGVVCGKAYFYQQTEIEIKKTVVADKALELQRYKTARDNVEKDLKNLSENFEEGSEIFEIQIDFLTDPSFGELIAEKISSDGFNAEYIVSSITEELADEFSEIEDEYFAQRALDIKDLGTRVIKKLLGIHNKPFEDMKEPSVVIAHDLTPSDTAYIEKSLLLGICTEKGSSTSHTAIISRSMGIPSLVGLRKIDAESGTNVIVDALEGALIIDPDENLQEQYCTIEENYNKKKKEINARACEKVITKDGEYIEVFANIGSLSDARLGKQFGAEGIGLLRTEFMFLDRDLLPDEEKQYNWYCEIASVFKDSTVIIRTMDIGGDKKIPSITLPKEENPFLGQRAIRLALSKPESLLIPQLKAILRTRAKYKVKMLLPMIARTTEITQIREAIEKAKNILIKEGKEFADIEIGIMVELPSTAVMADIFAPMVDFFSIGTNDLTQYTLAVDRTNEMITDIADYFDPAVIRLIQMVIKAAHEHGKKVGMCGSMAGDPLAAALLLGMGLDEFSMAAGMIPGIKDRLRRYKKDDLKTLVESCLNSSDAKSVRALCRPYLLSE